MNAFLINGGERYVLVDCLIRCHTKIIISNKFDNMSEPRHRKLTAMGIASFVSTARPEVLQRLPGEIFNLWLDVFGELREAEDQAALRTEDE